MESLNLSENEVRIIGCLMEKSVTTPDQIPLSLNALTSACNQKSSRTPVMSLTQGCVQHTTQDLKAKNLLLIEENFKTGAGKYKQRFCNTAFSELQFDEAQFAIICLLLLRGHQTPGELRTHCGRLHNFVDNTAVMDVLNSLINREEGALVIMLPRTPGRKDSEYTNLFSGPVDIQSYEREIKSTGKAGSPNRGNVLELEQRIVTVEADVAELKASLERMQ